MHDGMGNQCARSPKPKHTRKKQPLNGEVNKHPHIKE